MIKILGIGNSLMQDDGIGIMVAEALKNRYIEKNNIQVIIGETDVYYCIKRINKEDYLIIIDGAFLGAQVGTVSCTSIENCDYLIKNSFTAHNQGILWELRNHYRDYKGVLITIEVDKVNYGIGLSERVAKEFNKILGNVADEVDKIIGGKRRCMNYL